jgi:hypothetical protein
MVGFQRRFDAEFLRCRRVMSELSSATARAKTIVKIVVESRDPVGDSIRLYVYCE